MIVIVVVLMILHRTCLYGILNRPSAAGHSRSSGHPRTGYAAGHQGYCNAEWPDSKSTVPLTNTGSFTILNPIRTQIHVLAIRLAAPRCLQCDRSLSYLDTVPCLTRSGSRQIGVLTDDSYGGH